MSKPRCEDIGFQHLWDFDPGNSWQNYEEVGVPPHTKERTCVNCGAKQQWTCIRKPVTGLWDWREVPPDANG